MSTKTKNKVQQVPNVLETLQPSKPKEKQKSILHQSNDIAKQEYSFSQFVNKIKKDSNECFISLAFCKLCESETLRDLREVRDIPYNSLLNHFLPFYNIEQKYPIKVEKISWYRFSLFLKFVANLPTNKYNEIYNFSLNHKPAAK